MMKESRRALRMNRHHSRKKTTSLNMVSLMDIFTILVFFLLITSSTEESLPSSKDIKLPKAHADAKPKNNIVILVSGTEILIQGKTVTDTPSAIKARSAIIPKLAVALQAESAKRVVEQKDKDNKKVKKSGITIMGDKKIPYVLLKKIMLTCASADFTNISLAIVQKSQEPEGS